MESSQTSPTNIDEYISTLSPDVQAVLQKIRHVIRAAAPDAQEVISYKMPAFKANGVLLYFAAFKQHIGLYPPVKGDPALEADILPYAGEKGNLRFPLNQPIPFDLIERIARLRVKQDTEKAATKVKKKA